MKKTQKDVIVIGAALFAMFFGAGNLIFPPAIGMAAGLDWSWSLLGFLITGIGLPVAGVLAVSRAGGTIKDLAYKVSPKFCNIFRTHYYFSDWPIIGYSKNGCNCL